MVGAGQQVGPGLGSFAATEVQGDLVEVVLDLHDVPAWLDQRGHVQHRRLLAQVGLGVGVDGHVVGGDDVAVLGGLEGRDP